jgi:hypothetical protein
MDADRKVGGRAGFSALSYPKKVTRAAPGVVTGGAQGKSILFGA